MMPAIVDDSSRWERLVDEATNDARLDESISRDAASLAVALRALDAPEIREYQRERHRRVTQAMIDAANACKQEMEAERAAASLARSQRFRGLAALLRNVHDIRSREDVSLLMRELCARLGQDEETEEGSHESS